MVEIRFEMPSIDVATLDGYCMATEKNRTVVIAQLLADWSAAKQREAILICRVAGINPALSEPNRNDGE